MVHKPPYYYDYNLVGQTYTFYFHFETQFNFLHMTHTFFMARGASSGSFSVVILAADELMVMVLTSGRDDLVQMLWLVPLKWPGI